MPRQGNIHNMTEVKILVLYVADMAFRPLTEQELFHLCYQDETVSYFDVKQAILHLCDEGYLQIDDAGYIAPLDKGRQTAQTLQADLPYSLLERVRKATVQFEERAEKQTELTTNLYTAESGQLLLQMQMQDALGIRMSIEIAVPNREVGAKYAAVFRLDGEAICSAMQDIFEESM